MWSAAVTLLELIYRQITGCAFSGITIQDGFKLWNFCCATSPSKKFKLAYLSPGNPLADFIGKARPTDIKLAALYNLLVNKCLFLHPENRASAAEVFEDIVKISAEK